MSLQDFLASNSIFPICVFFTLVSAGLFVVTRYFLSPDSSGYIIYTAIGIAVLVLAIVLYAGHFA